MDHQVAVGVGDGFADLQKEAAAISHGKLALPAILVDGLAFDELHGQKGPAVMRSAAIDQARDVRMLEISQNLTLSMEAAEHILRVHAALDDLDGDLLAIGVVASRQIHCAHS